MRTPIIIFAALALVTGAHAADYRPGPYAGVTIGYAAGSLTNNTGDLATSGIPASGVVGYTHSIAKVGGLDLIIGAEGEIAWSSVKGSQIDRGFKLEASTDYTLSLKARAGMAIGPALVYVMAGPSWDHSKLEIIGLKDDHLGLGIIAGIGSDLQITNTVAFRIEAAQRISTGTTDWRIGFAAPIALDKAETTIRAGIVFNLN